MPTSTLLTAARRQVVKSLEALEEQLAQLADDQAGDTKSSAGDKFETSREMLQQELDRLEGQAQVLREQLQRLDLAARADPGVVAGLGSCVRLSDGRDVLLATGLGKVVLPEGDIAYVVSEESPLGRALWGATVGEVRVVAGRELRVVAVG